MVAVLGCAALFGGSGRWDEGWSTAGAVATGAEVSAPSRRRDAIFAPMDAQEFPSRYGPWALVAGASEGLGAAFARGLARRGLDLILVARRLGPLKMLADELERNEGVRVITASIDLASADLEEHLAAIAGEREVGLVVYNACCSTIAEYLDVSMADKQRMLDVNCRGPLVTTSWAAPKMVARGRGGLLLMSSMSGFQGTAMVSVYAATKAFNTVLGEGLWEELRPRGVDVLVCAAGATSTPNFNAQTPKAKRASVFPLLPEKVAEDALDHLGRGPRRIPGRLNRAVERVLRLLPRRGAVRFISRNTRDLYGAAEPALSEAGTEESS